MIAAIYSTNALVRRLAARSDVRRGGTSHRASRDAVARGDLKMTGAGGMAVTHGSIHETLAAAAQRANTFSAHVLERRNAQMVEPVLFMDWNTLGKVKKHFILLDAEFQSYNLNGGHMDGGGEGGGGGNGRREAELEEQLRQ